MDYKEIDFSKYSSIKIGGVHKVAVLEDPQEYSKEFFLLGGANNLLIGNNPPPLMLLSKKYDYITINKNKLIIGAATPSGKIASFCKKNNIANFEFLSHLPGTLGGLLKMNAGLKEYEIFENLLSLSTCENSFLAKDEIEYGYRYTKICSPILEASFSLEYGFDPTKVDLFKKMRANQPRQASAGSCFKNPDGDYAGRLIEQVGLKGKRVGAIEFSSVHANFLINHGGGNFEDALFLIKEAQKRVLEYAGISLECEILLVDN